MEKLDIKSVVVEFEIKIKLNIFFFTRFNFGKTTNRQLFSNIITLFTWTQAHNWQLWLWSTASKVNGLLSLFSPSLHIPSELQTDVSILENQDTHFLKSLKRQNNYFSKSGNEKLVSSPQNHSCDRLALKG